MAFRNLIREGKTRGLQPTPESEKEREIKSLTVRLINAHEHIAALLFDLENERYNNDLAQIAISDLRAQLISDEMRHASALDAMVIQWESRERDLVTETQSLKQRITTLEANNASFRCPPIVARCPKCGNHWTIFIERLGELFLRPLEQVSPWRSRNES